LTHETYAFCPAKGMLFVGRSSQWLPDAAGQLAGCAGERRTPTCPTRLILVRFCGPRKSGKELKQRFHWLYCCFNEALKFTGS
jgi:hypothetical protein